MHSSHYPSEIPYTRRVSREGYEAVEENSTVELFVKFRTFRPYLKKRLAKIYKDGRERELNDELEDIKYYLSVMSDMCADDNHGGDTLQGFIDRIHEMIRKNPNNDSHASSHTSRDDDEEDLDAERAPRSPSPTEIIDSDDPAPARPIPLEREQLGKDFSYFASLEDSLSNQTKSVDTSSREWDLGNSQDTYRRRGSFQDIDMRNESRYKHLENSSYIGRSTPSNTHRWDSDVGGSRSTLGRGAPTGDTYRDTDERRNREYNRYTSGGTERSNSWDRSANWRDRESSSWNQSGHLSNSSRRREDRQRSREREPEYRSQYHDRHGSEDSGSNWNRPYERASTYSRDSSYDRQPETPMNAPEPMFERRPQFERRANPTIQIEPNHSVQIDYNHGGAALEQPRDSESSNWLDRDMRETGVPVDYANGAAIFGLDMNDPGQRRYMEYVHVEAYRKGYLNSAEEATAARNLIPLANGREDSSKPAPDVAPDMRINNLPSVAGYAIRANVNTRPGILPIPPITMPQQDFGFQTPGSQSEMSVRPPIPSPTVENAHPFNRVKDSVDMNSAASSSNILNAIKNKALQHFSRQSAQKDNQNVPPNPTTLLPPPIRASKDLAVASNQLRSNYDPRLHGQKKNLHPANHSGKNDSIQQHKTPVESEHTKTSEPRRSEQSDHQQGTRRKDEYHSRIPSIEPLNRPGFAPLDPRRRNARTLPVTPPELPRPTSKSSMYSGRSRPHDIAPLDPRASLMREEFAEPPQTRDERNPRAEVHGLSRTREENRGSHSSITVNEERESSSKKLNDIRDRVRTNMNSSTPAIKTSKLQEIRKQVEREGFHALGRQINKKNQSSFDEALNPPVEKSPPRTVSKASIKNKSRDSSSEKVDSNLASQKSTKEKMRESKSKKLSEKKSKVRTVEKADDKGAKKQPRSGKHKSNHNSASQDKSPPDKYSFNEIVVPKRYRIPKLKKPDPIPPPTPSPPPSDSHQAVGSLISDQTKETQEILSDPRIQTSTNVIEEVGDEKTGTSAFDISGHLNTETEELVKQFIRRSVDGNNADSILKNQEAVNQVFELLKKQVQQMVHDELPTPSSSALYSQQSETAATIETGTEIQSHETIADEHRDDEPQGKATRQSRSITRKKSTKRRSSLEKLHDALQEMGFDADLPLGPRKCTRAPVVKPSEVPAGSMVAETSDQSKPSKKPKIILNPDDLNQILANADKNKLSVPISEELPPSNNTVDDMALDAGPSNALTPPVPGRRGRKRKRKGSKLKPNKKKKGPVTRAQAIVKTALKQQQKDKVKLPSLEASADLVIGKGKRKPEKGALKTEGRVTRSMIGKNSIISNLGLGKIKIEADYLPPLKIEPEDSIEDSMNMNDGTNHNHVGDVSDNIESDKLEDQAPFIEFPTLVDLNEDDDADEIMSIDITSEPDLDTSMLNEDLTPDEESMIAATESEPNTAVISRTIFQTEPDPEPDTDYNTDLSFLPIIPIISSVYSLNPVFHKNVLDGLLDKVKAEPTEEEPEIECHRDEHGSFNNTEEVSDILDWMVSTVEYQLNDSFKENFNSNLFRLSSESPVNIHDISTAISVPVAPNISDDEDVYEDNDYFVNVDSYSDDESNESNDRTDSDVDAEDLNDLSMTEICATNYDGKINIRNNEDSIFIGGMDKLLTQKLPVEHRVLHSSLIFVPRAGDGYLLSTLARGYISPSLTAINRQDQMINELGKLGPHWQGCRRSSVKSSAVYEQMLDVKKLVHLFKCMGTYCSYSGDSKEEFLEHVLAHQAFDANVRRDENPTFSKSIPYEDIKNMKDWNGCSYCSYNYKSPYLLVDHLINQHSQSLFQCGHCFYRGFYHRYIVRHSKTSHPHKECSVIKCDRRSESNYIEADSFRVSVYKCVIPTCSQKDIRFSSRCDFMDHLKLCSPTPIPSYPCYLCPMELPLEFVVEHYKEHSLFMYHCSYCKFASEDIEEIESHFANLHPNLSGRVFSRDQKSSLKNFLNSSIEESASKEPSTATLNNAISGKSKTSVPMEANDTLIETSSSNVVELKEDPNRKDSIPTPSLENPMNTNNIKECVDPEEKESAKARIDTVNGLDLLRSTGEADLYDMDVEVEDKSIINLEGQDLYKCANRPCHFMGVNATIFKDHVATCIFAEDAKQFNCAHCDKRVKGIANLIDHLKLHGRQKQLCSLCKFKTWIFSDLARHMKSAHKVYYHKVEKIEVEGDDEPDVIVFPKEVACRIISLEALKENFSRYADRLVFGPDELDKLPTRHIFHTLAYCSLCSYSTKVRVNIIRHLKFHGNDGKTESSEDKQIPESDPVNPVPCLERKELMFDKMTNWAGSTHAHKPELSAKTDTSSIPEFVLDQFRYVCSVSSCKQITTDENMLKAHMRALHSQVDIYRCPHCYKVEARRKDVKNTVPIDQLGTHLKLHGGTLFKCTYCAYVHPTPQGMSTHLPANHPEKKPIHYLVRRLDSEGVPITRAEDENTAVAGKWRCNICNSKNLFTSYVEAKTHCRINHRVLGQFLCAYCRFYTDSDTSIKEHILEDCREKVSDEGQIMVMWVRSEFADAVKPDDIFHGPLWKRSSHNVKHIRGIFLEDVKEKVSKSDSLSSGTTTASSHGNPPTPSVSGKKNAGKSSEHPPIKLQDVTSSTVENTSKSQTIMICPKCNRYKTKSRQDMTVHLFNELGYQRYGCPKCDLKFVTENSLKGHYTGDHGLIYDEKLCKLLPVDQNIEGYIAAYYAEQDELAKPADLAEVKSVDGLLLCKHCQHPCNSYHNLRTHILAKHIAADRYKCTYCPQTFYSEGLGYNHIRKFHPDLPLALTVNAELQSKLTPDFWMKEYGIPSKKTPDKKSLKLPPSDNSVAQSSDSSGNYRCLHCNFTTTELSTLSLHVEDYHNEDKCNSPRSDDTSLNNGSSTFTPNTEFLNTLFDNIHVDGDTVTPSLNNALRKQAHPNVYKCFHCLESFFTPRGARSHWKKTHSKIPEERCIYYEFKAFNVNMKLPPGMELVCGFCDYKVSSMLPMRNHHEADHPDETYRLKRRTRIGKTIVACGHCFHESSQIAQLAEHHKTKHPGTIMKYSVVDASCVEKSKNLDYFGKLIEDDVRFVCFVCLMEFRVRQDCKTHMRNYHSCGNKEPATKYNRQILNHRVKIPTDYEDDEKPTFKCPLCKFTSEDRQKLITDHLPLHIASYLCPLCHSSFKTFLETKFHIRHSHSDAKRNPLINRRMIEEREQLEKKVLELAVRKRANIKTQSTVEAPKELPKRRTSIPIINSQIAATIEPISDEEDDDIIIEDVIIVNPPTSGKFISHSRENSNINIATKKIRQLSEQDACTSSNISNKQHQERNTTSPWNLFEDYEDYSKIKSLKREDREEEPDIIEITPVNSGIGINWEIDGIPEFSRLSETDPFGSSFNWEEWEGKSS